MPKKAVNNGAFIDNVVISNYKTPHNLIVKIAEKHELPYSKVKQMLRYNVLTIKQLALVTGMTVNHVHGRLNGNVRKGNKIHYTLNSCNPFDELYLKFIYRNPKCQSLIEKYAGYEVRKVNYIAPKVDLIKQSDAEESKYMKEIEEKQKIINNNQY